MPLHKESRASSTAAKQLWSLRILSARMDAQTGKGQHALCRHMGLAASTAALRSNSSALQHTKHAPSRTEPCHTTKVHVSASPDLASQHSLYPNLNNTTQPHQHQPHPRTDGTTTLNVTDDTDGTNDKTTQHIRQHTSSGKPNPLSNKQASSFP